MEMLRREFSRKDILKMGLLGSAALFLPLERKARTQLAVANRMPTEQLPPPFQVPFVRPPVAKPVHSTDTTDYYEMTMKNSEIEILPGLNTEVWGYEGVTPGPTIEVDRGREVVVRHINGITNPDHKWTSVHLHGNASLPQYDGYANDTTKPGQYKDYQYSNFQDARTLWYHDHGLHDTAKNAYMGCAAFYISHDNLERSLPIPKGKYDVPLVLRDAILATDGSLIFDDGGHSNLFGDVILANGKPWPVMKVERRKYRFRALNGSLSRGFKLALSSGKPLTVIGTDGGLMPAPVSTSNLIVGMAERYEFVIDFAEYAAGEQVVLRNLGVENSPDSPTTGRVMRFDVEGEASDTTNNSVPSVLNPNSEVMNLQESEAVRTRTFEFGRACIGGTEDATGACVGGTEMWTINDKVWDPNRVDANPGPGDVEIWELTNKSGGWFHPIHMHLVDFKILSRTGGKNPGVKPYEKGPKDVAYVGEGETVRVLMRFGPHTGKYMIHCHNLVHEDHDMMTQFEVGQDGPDPVTSAPVRPLSEASPLVPSVASALTVGASAATVLVGRPVTLSGRLTSGGAGLANKPVVLEQRPVGAPNFAVLRSARTGSGGVYSFSGVTPHKHTDYRVRFSEETGYRSCASPAKRVNARVSIGANVSRTVLRLRQSLTISGTVNPAHSGKRVNVEIRRNGVLISSRIATLNASSRYSLSFKPPTAAGYSVIARFAGDADHLGNASPARVFRVIR